MSKNQNYKKLEQYFAEITHLKYIESIMNWDIETYMPNGSANSRAKEVTTLNSIIKRMSSSKELEYLIKKSYDEVNFLDEWQLRNLKLIDELYHKSVIIDDKIQQELNELSKQCEFKWREARKQNDFLVVVPYLDKIFELTRKIAEIKADKFNLKPYDALVGYYDPERSSEELDNVFSDIRTDLPGLIDKIIDSQEKNKILPLTKKIDLNTQKKIGEKIAEIIGFDFNYGRLDESIHPFSAGTNYDTRLTTKYDEVDILDAIYSTLHEAGHGIYQQNLPSKYRDQAVGMAYGMGFHESQSLIMERVICISEEFMGLLSGVLNDEFNITGPEYSAENLYKLKTKVSKSFIRIESDEVTYPLHVLMRYEIEKMIIDNVISAKDLPKIWNEKMQEYFGITPPNFISGCMQDIHWFKGSIGYFPSYFVGFVTASMLWDRIKNNIPNVNSQISQGNFSSINNYLNENLRSYGSFYKSKDLLNKSSGSEKLSSKIWLDYIKSKYLI